MTPGRLRACLDALGWSGGVLARQLGCREELPRRWLSGARGYAVPPGIAAWLERREAAANREPPPIEWWPPSPSPDRRGSKRTEGIT